MHKIAESVQSLRLPVERPLLVMHRSPIAILLCIERLEVMHCSRHQVTWKREAGWWLLLSHSSILIKWNLPISKQKHQANSLRFSFQLSGRNRTWQNKIVFIIHFHFSQTSFICYCSFTCSGWYIWAAEKPTRVWGEFFWQVQHKPSSTGLKSQWSHSSCRQS